jgi:putative RecB family exonuclease
MRSYFGCGLRYYYEKVLRLPAPVSPALQVGKAVHEGLRGFHVARWRGGDASTEAVLAGYNTAFAALEQTEGPVDWAEPNERTDALAAGERVLRAYLSSEHAQAREVTLGVEVVLNDSVPGLELPLTGVVDLVRGGPVATDFKTAGSTPGDLELEAFLHENQLVAYQMLLEAATGEQVTALELVFLIKTKNPRVIVHRVERADEVRQQRFLVLASAYIAGVRAKRFHPQPGTHCAWCSYRSECRAWKGGAP